MSKQAVIIFDLDGVLAEYHGYGDGEIGKPLKQGIDLAYRLHEDGFKILVQTCRTSYGDNLDARSMAAVKVSTWLHTHLPIAILDLSNGKAHGHVYLDDRGVHIPPNWAGVIDYKAIYGATFRLAFDAIEQEENYVKEGKI